MVEREAAFGYNLGLECAVRYDCLKKGADGCWSIAIRSKLPCFWRINDIQLKAAAVTYDLHLRVAHWACSLLTYVFPSKHNLPVSSGLIFVVLPLSYLTKHRPILDQHCSDQDGGRYAATCALEGRSQ